MVQRTCTAVSSVAHKRMRKAEAKVFRYIEQFNIVQSSVACLDDMSCFVTIPEMDHECRQQQEKGKKLDAHNGLRTRISAQKGPNPMHAHLHGVRLAGVDGHAHT